MTLVNAENLKKRFGLRKPVWALDGLDLCVNEGEVFGLLGPNGSGKTTFVKCCLNIIFPTSGTVRVLGQKPGSKKITRQVGYLPENPNFYDHLTGSQFLYYHSELAGIPLTKRRKRVKEVLEMVQLKDGAASRRLRTYSKGMTQRIGLAQALLNEPRLMFLDEPQTGLDPIGRRLVKDIMREAVKRGSTVLFSSHVLGDVQDVADRVAIIDRGRMRKIATMQELTMNSNMVSIRLKSFNSTDISTPEIDQAILAGVQPLLDELGAGSAEILDGLLTCTLKDEEDIPRLIAGLASNGHRIYEVSRERLNLEEVFIREFGNNKDPET